MGLAAAVSAARTRFPDPRLAPGWTDQDKLRGFVTDDLFEYVDGNAEGCQIRGFEEKKWPPAERRNELRVAGIKWTAGSG
jgi:hypothetical protein